MELPAGPLGDRTALAWVHLSAGKNAPGVFSDPSTGLSQGSVIPAHGLSHAREKLMHPPMVMVVNAAACGPRFYLCLPGLVGTSTETWTVYQVSIFEMKACQCAQKVFSVPVPLNDPPLLSKFAFEWGPPGSWQ